MITDLSRRVEAELRGRTSPLFPADAAECIVLPDYRGRSLANVPATLLALLGEDVGATDTSPSVLPAMSGPLDDLYWAGVGPVRRLVVVLLDAVGYLPLTQRLAERENSIWARLARAGRLLPMTSVCPSTTATALSTLSTGLPPAAHAMLGYELWLREFGLLTQMLAMQPALGPGKETLLDWGLRPETMLPNVGLGQRCDEADIQTTAFVPAQYVRGALSRMCYRRYYRVAGYADAVDLWDALHHLLSRDDAERSLYMVYWGAIDHTVHEKGTAGGHWQTALDDVTRAAEERFFWRLTRDRRADTAVVLLADHGFTASPLEAAHYVDDDPVFRRRLLIPHSGESRLAYLHCQQGDVAALRAEFAAALGDGFHVVPSRDALAGGLFGPGEPHPETVRRLGDLVAAALGDGYLSRGEDAKKLRGRHGGLSPQEMLVPWLVARLDAL